MSWHEDLRHIDLQDGRFTVVDKVKEGDRLYLGLAPFDAVAEVVAARDAGRPRPLPPALRWVEEREGAFVPLTKKEAAALLARKGERAAEAFRRR